jgi:hypothetical protein
MSISINYKKRKNSTLFNQFQNIKKLNLENIQNYIPIYDRFFSLNSTNWNTINLNHLWSIAEIKDKKDTNSDYIYNAKLRHISEDEFVNHKSIFIKLAPLLDPFKYLVGKYNYSDEQLFNLPSFDNCKIHPKISNPNNSSYVDGFFAFLTSKILHEHEFIHGLDYYGSFLAIKNNYKINIIDDLDYLVQSEFFNKHKDSLFHVDDYTHLIETNEIKELKPLIIKSAVQSLSSVKTFNDDIFEDIFNDEHLTLQDIKDDGIELLDITDSILFDTTNKSNNLKSDSSCSSRTSHTEEEEVDILSEDDSEDEFDDIEDIDDIDDIDDNSENYTDIEDNDEDIMLTFPKFPVQVICMEHCENTLDDLILNNSLTDDEWFSALFQIIMMLVAYQKMFAFTHNDLHTNNVMYIQTNQKFIYYKYKNNIYKVPTFGRIYKLIDFGRAIYKFNGKIFCSDSFQSGGDASTQYNTEPYFNDKKPRLEPNFSFDLCRLACSIFDYVVTDFDAIKQNNCSSVAKIINEWCIDDNGINVLYKNNGTERYPDFKLYKMIARHVHNHTPHMQLERSEFKKFLVTESIKKSAKNSVNIMDLDILPSYI